MSAFTEANRRAFDDLSSEYDSKPWRLRMSKQIAEALEERKDWIGLRWAQPDDLQYGRETRLLDYACGTGSITRALGPWVTHIRGIDISENMVQKYNETAQSSGLTSEQANAVVGDLLAEEVPSHLTTEEYYNFDIAVIGLGFHHFENPMLAIQRLTERLKPGTGVLLIIDFLPFDPEQEGPQGAVKHTIKHGGFARTNMEKMYEKAGLENFSFSVLEEPAVMETKHGGTNKRDVFIARGRREPTKWGKVVDWFWSMQHVATDQFQIEPREEVPKEFNLVGGHVKGLNEGELEFGNIGSQHIAPKSGWSGLATERVRDQPKPVWKML
ncbi:hypothetical protein LTR37_010963 [Vermiconidia calcicola]|uniref:Uncharacterized protein n=1 Tax=Vermiconidia calcicola TaxID=1690605 RepID=A0ACC3N3N6_9PEZI|nr:hypothetical protein LTR37_010963 [Vermiconidia calcicola]